MPTSWKLLANSAKATEPANMINAVTTRGRMTSARPAKSSEPSTPPTAISTPVRPPSAVLPVASAMSLAVQVLAK